MYFQYSVIHSVECFPVLSFTCIDHWYVDPALYFILHVSEYICMYLMLINRCIIV